MGIIEGSSFSSVSPSAFSDILVGGVFTKLMRIVLSFFFSTFIMIMPARESLQLSITSVKSNNANDNVREAGTTPLY